MLDLTKILEVLKSLVAHDPEEWSALRLILSCADFLYQGRPLPAVSNSPRTAEDAANLSHQLLEGLPGDYKRYLYGLVEALEIYHSIHGKILSVGDISPAHPSIGELRQIREMCLDDSLHCVY
jgi:hypothetical protein